MYSNVLDRLAKQLSYEVDFHLLGESSHQNPTYIYNSRNSFITFMSNGPSVFHTMDRQYHREYLQ